MNFAIISTNDFKFLKYKILFVCILSIIFSGLFYHGLIQ